MLDYHSASALAMEGPLRCRSESGGTYVAKIHEYDPEASALGLSPRIADLLNQQACLEKLALHNAAVLGAYVSLLQKEVSAAEWSRMSAALIKPYAQSSTSDSSSASDAITAAASYPILSAYVELFTHATQQGLLAGLSKQARVQGTTLSEDNQQRAQSALSGPVLQGSATVSVDGTVQQTVLGDEHSVRDWVAAAGLAAAAEVAPLHQQGA